MLSSSRNVWCITVWEGVRGHVPGEKKKYVRGHENLNGEKRKVSPRGVGQAGQVPPSFWRWAGEDDDGDMGSMGAIVREYSTPADEKRHPGAGIR